VQTSYQQTLQVQIFQVQTSYQQTLQVQIYPKQTSLVRMSSNHLSQAKLSNTNLDASNFEGSIILKPIDLESSLIELFIRIPSSNKLTNIKLPVFIHAITDDAHLFRLLLKIKPENVPILVESKEQLVSELKKKKYSDKQIERFVSQSKFD
jgi:hypothetical protein